MQKFWNWVRNSVGGVECRVLELRGYIAQESWYEDDVTPAIFKEELFGKDGKSQDDIIVRINSGGGDCFAAAQIYDALKQYKGNVTIEIDALAASAASVIAMAGDEVKISPVGILMIHNPSTIAWGESSDMQKAINLLDEVKETIMNAYENKTGMSRAKLSHMMDDETWMSAKKAVELGFVDSILYTDNEPESAAEADDGFLYGRVPVFNSFLGRLPRPKNNEKPEAPEQHDDTQRGVPADQLQKRLALLKH